MTENLSRPAKGITSSSTAEYFSKNLQQVGFSYGGIIINPGGYTHTSVAIGDAIAAISTPVVEVHISNVHAREEFRRLSHVSAKAKGTIAGLGLKGYELALLYLLEQKK